MPTMRVFRHSFPLFLIVADILKLGGKPGGGAVSDFVFQGIKGEYDATGKLRGVVTFEGSGGTYGVRLLWCP